MQPDHYAVLELSSFQLMTMTCSPHIAVVTNLAPNHLDVHKDMAEYVAAKENIFRYQKAGDVAVFNFDNDITRAQGQRVSDRAVYFSRQSEPEKGVFLRGEDIVCRDSCGERTICPHRISNCPAFIMWKTIWQPLPLSTALYRTM